MISLTGKIRQNTGRRLIKSIRGAGIIPAVLYGPEIKPVAVSVDSKEFKKVFEKAGQSSLISLQVENKKYSVLIHEVQKNPVKEGYVHIDFYQPILTQETEATVPLVFEGESLAVKEMSGTLVKDIQEVQVRALPADLPHEIKVDISKLKTFEDEILIKDLEALKGVKILKALNEVVASVVPLAKVEEELEKPIEEKVEEVEKVEKERKEEQEPEEVQE